MSIQTCHLGLDSCMAHITKSCLWTLWIMWDKMLIDIVVRIECWLVGSYNSTSYSTLTVLRLYPGSSLPCFPLFPLFFAVFLLFSLFFCLVSLFFLYFLCFLLGSSVFPLFSVFLLGSSVFPLFSPFISLNSIKNIQILFTNRVMFLVFYVRSSADRSYVESRSWLHRERVHITNCWIWVSKKVTYITV